MSRTTGIVKHSVELTLPNSVRSTPCFGGGRCHIIPASTLRRTSDDDDDVDVTLVCLVVRARDHVNRQAGERATENVFKN